MSHPDKFSAALAALAKGDNPFAKGTHVPVLFDGVQYRSMAEALRKLKIRHNSFRYRTRHLGEDPLTALRHLTGAGKRPKGCGVRVTVDGVTYPSAVAAARALGIPPDTMYGRRRDTGQDYIKILEELRLAGGGPPRRRPIRICGRWFPSLRSAAAEFDLHRSTLAYAARTVGSNLGPDDLARIRARVRRSRGRGE